MNTQCMTTFTKGWLAGKQINKRSTSILCKTNISHTLSLVFHTLILQQQLNKMLTLLFTVVKQTEMQTLWSRWKPLKIKDKVRLCLSQPLFPSRKRKAVRLVIKHTSPMFCHWSMRGSEGEDGRRRENTDTKCMGFFLGFHFVGLNFPKIRWCTRSSKIACRSDRDLISDNNKTGKCSDRTSYVYPLSADSSFFCSGICRGEAGQKFATIQLLLNDNKKCFVGTFMVVQLKDMYAAI